MKLFTFGKNKGSGPYCTGADECRERLLWASAIVLAVLAVYYPVVGFEFLNYDDPANVYENNLIINFSLASLQCFWGGIFMNLYIPLTYTTWGILARLAQLLPASTVGLNPLPFHLANLGLHIASALVLSRLFRQLGAGVLAATAGALLFALHPIQVEAVAWVTGLKDLLSSFLVLLAIYCYLRHASACRDGGGGAWGYYGLACGFFSLALLAKPSTVTAALLAGVIAYYCVGRPLRKLAGELLPILALSLPLIIITRAAQPGSQFPLHFDFWQQLLLAADALSFYLGKVFWPAVLGPDYGRTQLSTLNNHWVLASLLAPAALGVVFFWCRRKGWLRAAVLVFVLALLPVLGFMPFNFQKLSTVADRYLYLAMLGPALLVAMGWEHLPPRTGRLVVFVLLAGLAARSAFLVRSWHDSFSFYRLALQVNPASYNSYNHLGVAHQLAGNYQEAQAAFQMAIATGPFAPDAYCNQGDLYAAEGRHLEALENFRRAAQLAPRSPARVYMRLGDEYRAVGDFATSLNSYLQALDASRIEQLGSVGTAKLYASLGALYGDMGRSTEAIAAFRQALAMNPGFAEAYSDLGVVYGAKGDYGAAEECYRRAIDLAPDMLEPYNNLGLLLTKTNRLQEAVTMLRKAVSLAPGQPVPLNNLNQAYQLAGQPALATR